MAVDLGRLRLRSEFLRVAAASRKCVKPGLILQAASRESHDQNPRKDFGMAPRLGFTVTRKVGNAVDRNRARRRLRAAAREVFAGLALPGHDYVVIGRRETLARPFPDLLADLADALRKIGDSKRVAASR
jgi:ribonuclease P protein component